MEKSKSKKIIFLSFLVLGLNLNAQIDSTKSDDEDYSQYDNVEDVGKIKVYCNPKIFGLSPAKFGSIGYDFLFPSHLKSTNLGSFDENAQISDSFIRKHYVQSLRLFVNIPVVSKASILWQVGAFLNQNTFCFERDFSTPGINDANFLSRTLNNNGLTNLNLNTTVFKPLNDKYFIVAQAMGEISGNFSLRLSQNFPGWQHVKGSYSAIFGKRPHDRLQWGVGISRTFRAGELNYIPVVMYNYTSVNRKWGTEILVPARAAYRRNFSARSLLLAGYDLEGSTYLIRNSEINSKNLELRRSEIRVKLEYQQQLKGFFWLSVMGGVRQNLNYNIDALDSPKKEIFRGFFGNQQYAMLNEVGMAPFLQLSVSFVSP